MQLDISNDSLPVYEALASKTRLQLLQFVGNEKRSVGEIAKHLGISNAITTRHIQQLEDAGLLDSERGTGKNRNKKMVFLKVDDIHISFPEKIYKALHLHTTNLKIGHFTDFSVSPTCGLATKQNIIGKIDEPKHFMNTQRVEAGLVWFKEGYLEYKIPNMLQEHEIPEMLEIIFEVSSEFPMSNNVWPSDITIYVNGIQVAVYTVPGNFSDVRGRYTPSWWDSHLSQYGLLKHIRITKLDTAIDGEVCSPVKISELGLENEMLITLRFAVEQDAKHKGGMTLFGEGFGNHQQDIIINTYYSI